MSLTASGLDRRVGHLARESKAASAAIPMSRPARYRSLDLWRGVACLGVVLYHVPERLYPTLAARASSDPIARGVLSICQAGSSGVALFFVISGYCIAAAADPARSGTASSWEFARRRAMRIGPPFWAALVFTGLLSAILWRAGKEVWLAGPCWGGIGDSLAMSPRQWVGNLLLSESWLARWAGPGGRSGLLLGPSWTLCYEAQFYAIAALLLTFAPRRLFAMSCGVAVFAATVLVLRKTPVAATLDGTCLDGRWITFFIGMIVYQYVNCQSSKLTRWTPLVMVIASVAGFVGGMGRSLILHEILVGSAFGAVLCLGHRFDEALSSCRLAAPLLWCGTISYSLYLMHWPVGRLIMGLCGEFGLLNATAGRPLAIGLGIVGSLLAGWAFHVLIERRTMPSAGAVRHRLDQAALLVPKIEL